MKTITTGIFESRDAAEKAINKIHNVLKIPNDDISYVYKNTKGDVREVAAGSISTKTPGEAAKRGATVGGTLGALAGLAAVAGIIPVVGPIFAAGALTTALGLTGAVGVTAAGAVTGAAAGGLIGALAGLGVGKEHAKRYEDRVMAGDILVMVHAADDKAVSDLLDESGAIQIETFKPVV